MFENLRPRLNQTATLSTASGQLAEEIARTIRARSAILDGEIVCLDLDGRSNFKNLLFRRVRPVDVGWARLAGASTYRPASVSSTESCLVASRVLLMEHIEERGCDLFAAALVNPTFKRIVANWRYGRYTSERRQEPSVLTE
jgi:hypothetical protein